MKLYKIFFTLTVLMFSQFGFAAGIILDLTKGAIEDACFESDADAYNACLAAAGTPSAHAPVDMSGVEGYAAMELKAATEALTTVE